MNEFDTAIMNNSFQSAAIAGNATVGGRFNVKGNATLCRNLRVEGWLDAPNIKGPLKGWFRDIASLEAHYRHPSTGWLALVGTSLPAPVYIAEKGRWQLSETTGGELTVEAGKIAEDVETLQAVVDDTAMKVGSLEANQTVLSGDDDEYELAVADEEGNVVMGVAGGHIRTRDFDSSALREDILVADSPYDETNPPEEDSRIEADLCLADDKGNIVAAFANGHFRTRLFDSSEITGATVTAPATHPAKGKVLSILGDSISTFAGQIPDGYLAYYPKGDVTAPSMTYWHILATELGLKLGANCSWSGSFVHGDGTSALSAAAGCSNRRIADLAANGTPDYILVYIGINDFDEGTPLGDYTAEDHWIADGVYNDFSHAYGLMLQKLMKAYPLARILVCTLMEASFRDTDGVYPAVRSDGTRLADFNRVIRSLAEGYGLTLVDLHSCGIHWANMDRYYHDSTLHPNAAGHRLMAAALNHSL